MTYWVTYWVTYRDTYRDTYRATRSAPADNTARSARTQPRCRRYSASPLRSAGGSVPSATDATAAETADASTRQPAKASSTCRARNGVEPIFVNPTPRRLDERPGGEVR